MGARQQKYADLDTAILDIATLELSKKITDGNLTESIVYIEP